MHTSHCSARHGHLTGKNKKDSQRFEVVIIELSWGCKEKLWKIIIKYNVRNFLITNELEIRVVKSDVVL